MYKGKLYLIPTILSKNTQETTLPKPIKNYIKTIDLFIVENIRTARRYIKSFVPEKDIDKITFYSYGKNDTLNLEEVLLNNSLNGQDIGLLSEAGLPCIADPGSEIVRYAHNFQIDVVPLVGPSSILLALIASGMNGQSFTFNGYLPIEKIKRNKKIKKLESIAIKTGKTQIFIETPYRNEQLFNALLDKCNLNTRLCIASEVTSQYEFIKTKTIAEWRNNKVILHKKPCIFLIS